MQLRSVAIQNFRSFVGQQEIDFTKMRPGLYHLAGRNDVEPAISPNGAGKSSLLEAPCWLGWGTTSRKLKAGAVGNWAHPKGCGGVLSVKTAQYEVDVLRTWNPNALEVSIDGGEPKPADQKEVEELLGLSFEAYLYSIYFAQFTPAFIDLRPAEQMGVFSAVLGLDLWEKASEEAGKQARALEAVVARCREDIARLAGQLSEAQAALSRLDGEEQAWLETMAAKEEQLTVAKATAEAALTTAKKERDKHAKGSEQFRAKRELVQTATQQVALREAEVRRLQKQIDELGRKDVKNCPTCGQPVTNKHLKEEINRLEQAKLQAQGFSNGAVFKHDKAMLEMTQFSDEEVKLLEAEKQLSAVGADHQNATLALERLCAEVNPFDAQRTTLNARGEKLASEQVNAKAALGSTETEQGASVFWAKSFKELRLSLIEESLAQLSVEANSALVELGLKDWELQFDVERETKKGTLSKGFTILVRAPHMKEQVPWEVWSGGESQRLRVACSLGFAELICSRMGITPNVEFFDEPSQWLSEGGIHDLLQSLADRAERRGKVILLADHRALDFGGFAGTITVAKTAKGSEILL